LRGDHVDSGQAAKTLTLLWNRKRGIAPGDVLPLPAPEPLPLTNGEDFDVRPVGWQAPPPRAKQAGQRRRVADASGKGHGRGRGAGGGEVAPLPLPPPPPPVVGPSGPGPAAEPREAEEDLDAAPLAPRGRPARGGKEDAGWEDVMGDAKVCFKNYQNKLSGALEPNWRIKCGLPDCQKGCDKRRGATERHEAHHGIIEPLAFLLCWRCMDWPSKPRVTTHRQDEPTQEAVGAFVAEHAKELRDIVKLFDL
jgi:hypothetical protein